MMIRNKYIVPRNSIRYAMADWVRKVRERHDMTQAEFASALGYKSPSQVSMMETVNNSTNDSMNTYVVQRVCKVFGVHCFIHFKEDGSVTVS
jgi:transcriptional regulator with XRE-family HTH domain